MASFVGTSVALVRGFAVGGVFAVPAARRESAPAGG
jgi:hypothetical protein